jgi:hypothetical protein
MKYGLPSLLYLGSKSQFAKFQCPHCYFPFWLAKSTCKLLSSWLFEAWDESFQNSRYPPLYTNFLNILRANWKRHECCWIGAILMEWKLIHENSWNLFDEIKFIQEIPSITLFHPWSVVHSQFFFCIHVNWVTFCMVHCQAGCPIELHRFVVLCSAYSSCSGTQFSFWCSAKKNIICFYNPTWDSTAQPQRTKI